MPFNVQFYSFSKRENSTVRPTGDGTVYSCVLKSESSQASPVIETDLGTADRPVWNYAYIPDFSRYYWISDWTWIENRLWQATLTTDLLATFRDQIGAASLYVLRSSAASDGTISDTYYPSKSNSQFTIGTIATPFTFNAQSGSFVVGIASGLHPTYGTNTYYLLDPTQLDALMQSLNTDIVTVANDFLETDASYALQKSLIDPFQYITSCIWFPLAYADMPYVGGQRTITAGGFELNATGAAINASTPIKELSMSFTLQDHPQIARGAYLNATHRKLFLEIPPFGAVELDSTIACNYTKIIVKIGIDCISGMATIRIGCGNENDITELLERYETQLGVPMQLTNIASNVLGAAGGVVTAAASAIGNLFAGNAIGAISGAASGIGNIMENAKPRMQSIGGTGSFSSLTNTVPQGTPTSYTVNAKLYTQFMIIVDEDLDHAGRPLCQIRQVNTLPGYLLIKDAELDLPGFSGESEAVRAYLENGFFYG